MPLQNRVTPFSTIEAVPARGLFTGNRGVLHGDARNLLSQGWRHKAWIICALAYKGWRRTVMTPRRWTELFFLDEATALAAGHRPCALCRRAAYQQFVGLWAAATGERPRAPLLDAALHAERVPRMRGRATTVAELGTLPSGCLVTLPGAPDVAWLWHGTRLRRWSHDGYTHAETADGRAVVHILTPASTVMVLRAGYVPALHPTATLPKN